MLRLEKRIKKRIKTVFLFCHFGRLRHVYTLLWTHQSMPMEGSQVCGQPLSAILARSPPAAMANALRSAPPESRSMAKFFYPFRKDEKLSVSLYVGMRRIPPQTKLDTNTTIVNALSSRRRRPPTADQKQTQIDPYSSSMSPFGRHKSSSPRSCKS